MDADPTVKSVVRDADENAPGRSIPLQLETQLMFLKHKARASTLLGALDPLGLMQRGGLCSKAHIGSQTQVKKLPMWEIILVREKWWG